MKRKRNPAKDQAARDRAFKILNKVQRPPGVTATQWAGVMTLCWVVARWQPECFMGQERLAEETSMGVRSVQRYTALAEDLGLLKVIPDAGVRKAGNPSRTHRYYVGKLTVRKLTELTAGTRQVGGNVPANLAANTKSTFGTPSPASAKKQRETSSLSVSPQRASGPLSLSQEEDMTPEERRAGVQKAEAASARAGSRRGEKRPAAKPVPARRLTGYFLDRWEVTRMDAAPDVREARVIDTVGEVSNYIRTTFLAPADGRRYTEAEVRAFIDAFMKAVLLRQARIKPGQSVWRCFTGWWGRRRMPSYNPSKYDRYLQG